RLDLAALGGDVAAGTDRDERVGDAARLVQPLVDPRDDEHAVPPRHLSEPAGERAVEGLRRVDEPLVQLPRREHRELGEHDDPRAALRRLARQLPDRREVLVLVDARRELRHRDLHHPHAPCSRSGPRHVRPCHIRPCYMRPCYMRSTAVTRITASPAWSEPTRSTSALIPQSWWPSGSSNTCRTRHSPSSGTSSICSSFGPRASAPVSSSSCSEKYPSMASAHASAPNSGSSSPSSSYFSSAASSTRRNIALRTSTRNALAFAVTFATRSSIGSSTSSSDGFASCSHSSRRLEST